MSLTIKLRYPIKNNDHLIEELNLRRLTMGDMLVATKRAAGQEELGFLLLAQASGLSPDILVKMDIADFIQSQGVFAEYLGIPVPGLTAA